jgi:AcrR family transcriptional regulator
MVFGARSGVPGGVNGEAATPQAPEAEAARPGLGIKNEVSALKRQRILEEASRLFFEKGYSGSTLDALAKRLDVTKPFIYSYYASKADLLAAICETGITLSLAEVERALRDHADPLGQLRAAVTGVTEVVMRYQNYVVIYQREMKVLDRRDAQRILKLRHHFDQQMARLLERGVASGVFRLNETAMTSVWIGGLLSWIPNWYVPGGRRSERDVIDSLVGTVLRIVGAAAPS